MSVTVVIALTVENHDKFEVVFTERASARAEAGLEAKAYKDIDDANRVVVIGTAPSKEAFMGFMTSHEQQEAMKAGGIQGPPDVTFLKQI